MSAELVARDDHLVHLGPGTVSSPAAPSRDPRFFERYWNVLHDDTGDLVVAIGGSFYPNLDRAESYAIVNLRGEHRSVRAFRPLGPDRDNLTVGPLEPRIACGLRQWRHQLSPGEWGFGYDLTVSDTHHQVYNEAWGAPIGPSSGATAERQVSVGFEGFATVTGWVQVGDTGIEWPVGTAHGTRDRHWGVGRGVGGPALNNGQTKRGGWKGGIWIDLGDLAIWGKQVLHPLDDLARSPGQVVHVRRRLRFEGDTQVFIEGLVDLTFDDGTQRQLHLERLGAQTAYMRCGFYGGTPEAGLQHGEYAGPARVEWDRFDVTDPGVRLALRGLDEHHCRVTETGGPGPDRVTTGILQPLEPDAYEACVAGKPGWEFL